MGTVEKITEEMVKVGKITGEMATVEKIMGEMVKVVKITGEIAKTVTRVMEEIILHQHLLHRKRNNVLNVRITYF